MARPIPVPAPVTRATGAAPSVIEFLSRQRTRSVDCLRRTGTSAAEYLTGRSRPLATETSAPAVLFVKFGLGVNRVASNEVAGEIRKPVRPEAVRGAATLLLQRERTTCAQAAGRPTSPQAARSPPPRPRSTQRRAQRTHAILVMHKRHRQQRSPTASSISTSCFSEAQSIPARSAWMDRACTPGSSTRSRRGTERHS